MSNAVMTELDFDTNAQYGKDNGHHDCGPEADDVTEYSFHIPNFLGINS